MVLGAIMFAVLALPLSALAVDTARWWVEAQRIQAAADAASTAGVTFMPDDFNAAKARALEVAKINGYDSAAAGTTVTVVPGDRPTRLRVTISQTVDNLFAQSFGVGTSTVARGSMSDYNGPAPLGSPCNTFGNEPAGGSATTSGPVDSVLPGMIPASAVCSSNPQFWANIGGPDWPKSNGDQYMTRNCGATGVSGCTGTKNDEFDPLGYFYVIRVGPSAVNKSVRIQLYDPAFVAQGDYCETGPTPNSSGVGVNNNNWNTFATLDAIDRYKKQASGATNTFCTGDVATSTAPTITSFGLRGVTATKDPRVAPPLSTSTCIKQYPGYAASTLTRDTLRSSAPATTYNPKLAKVFHQWVTMCDFTPSEAGDYYIQVRTNVALGGALGTDGIYTGNTQVLSQTTDDPAVGGGGGNRFAIRAYAPSGGIAAGDLSVSSQERMPIYANATGANSTFNLVRVIPAAAGKTLVFGFFDVGEAATGGTMQVLPPADSNMPSNVPGCKGSGVVNGNLTNCEITGIQSSGWNGKQQFISVPIPNSYTCATASQGGCWFRVGVNFGAGNVVNDSTTWTAKIVGEPIRLVE